MAAGIGLYGCVITDELGVDVNIGRGVADGFAAGKLPVIITFAPGAGLGDGSGVGFVCMIRIRLGTVDGAFV